MKRGTHVLATTIGVVFTLSAATFVAVVDTHAARKDAAAAPVVWLPPKDLPEPQAPPPARPPKPSASPATATPARVTGRAATTGNPIHRLNIKERAVFITIDDGNTRDPRVLDLIRRTHLPVSAFLIQDAVDADARYWQAMARAGVKIENHTRTHPRLTSMGYAAQRSQICAPQPRYRGLFGARPHLFRPPYGRWNPTTLNAAASCGITTTVLWSATYGGGYLDTWSGSLRPGDIVLMHFKPGLYDDLLRLMKILRANGLGVGSLEDYVRGSAVTTTKSASPRPSPEPSSSPSPSPSPSLPLPGEPVAPREEER